MGAFYTTIAIKGARQPKVRETLAKLRRVAYVSPAKKGFTFVYDRKCDDQDTKDVCELARKLSSRLGCVAWGVLNHDDDILWYVLCRDGEYVDSYNSEPNFFADDAEPAPPEGGDATVLCRLLGKRSARTKVESILRKPQSHYGFASHRHRDLTKALGVPFKLASIGYEDFDDDGELPRGVRRDDFVRVGK